MEDQEKQETVTVPSPHVLVFPLPLQGPVNFALKLAELLCLSGIRVTFLNTNHVHRRLLHYADGLSRFDSYPNFCFETIADGVRQERPGSARDQFQEVLASLKAVTAPLFREMMISGRLSCKMSAYPVTLMIPDASLSFAIDIARETGIPVIPFETVSPSCLWTYFCLPKLIETGEIPFQGEDLDVGTNGVPGMESFLRRCDLPSFCCSNNVDDPILQLKMNEAIQLPQTQGLIINTFEALDTGVLPHIRNSCPNIYTLGPLHSLHKARIRNNQKQASTGFWEEERNCLSWLDKQSSNSVIYISIGSTETMTVEQMMEIWYGAVNSGKHFLWVRRVGSVVGEYEEGRISRELKEGTKQRGFFVGWAPQEQILAHPAIGVFLTDSGWNSTLASIVEGVPMICWPHSADQEINSRFVSEVWKLGIDIKDTCDRVRIEKMVRDLMEVRRDQFMQSLKAMAEMAAQSVSEGGSSCTSLDRLVNDIRLMSSQEK